MFRTDKTIDKNRLVITKIYAIRKILCMFLTFALLVSSMVHFDMVSNATAISGEGTPTTEATTEEVTTEATTEASQSGTGANASVEQARENMKDAKEKKEEAQKVLNALEDKQNDIKNSIVQLDLSITKMQAQITELEMSQKELEKSIKETEENLALAQAAEKQQYELMKQRIQMVYESGNKGYLEALLSATSVTDIINKIEYTSQISAYDYNILSGLQESKATVAAIKQKLDMDLASNEKLQKDMAADKESMEALVGEKNVEMQHYEQSISEQKKELEQYEKAIQEAESIIFAAEQASGAYASTGPYTGGTFMWPVPGYNEISSYFGSRTSPVAGASSNHKGIDIPCDSGVPVVAATSGTVIVATYNYAEGNYVVIDHGGGVVTLYMHNSSLVVSVGQTVSAGETIAYAGSTGVSTGPHCHFGVRVNGSYVDPLSYLQ